MTESLAPSRTGRLILDADTAADLMTPNPVSVRQNATVREVISLLVDRGVSGTPVIDAAGRAVGVVTQTDILIHDREAPGSASTIPDYYKNPVQTSGSSHLDRLHPGIVDSCPVSDIMTPGVLAVKSDTPVSRVVADMLALQVHRLFVLDHDEALVGVIGLFDILRRLRS